MTAKHPKTRPAPLRDQITAYLTRKTEATAKDIAQHTSEAAFPSRVLNELNRMRTDALVECEKRKGKGNEYYYWLTNAAQNGAQPQPEVGENTGRDGSDIPLRNGSKAAAVAVQEPSPAAVAPTAAPGEEDDTERLKGADEQLAMFHEICRRYGIGCYPAGLAGYLSRELELRDQLVARSSKAAADLGELERQYKDKDAELLNQASVVVYLRAKLAAAEQKRIETTGALTRSMQDLDAIREHLAPFSGEIDPSDMTEVELAQCAAAAISDGMDRIFSRDSGVVARSTDTTEAVDVLDAAAGYLIRIPKRRPRIVTKPEKVRDAAVAAVRNGAERADVFALIPLGTAKRGAVWSPAK